METEWISINLQAILVAEANKHTAEMAKPFGGTIMTKAMREKDERRQAAAIEKQLLLLKTAMPNPFRKGGKKRRKGDKKNGKWYDSSGKASFTSDRLKDEGTVPGGLPGSGPRS